MGDIIKKGRVVASALAVSVGLSACAAEETNHEGSENQDDVADWGDESKYPELGGAYHHLSALTGTCVYDTTTKVVTITSTAAQTIIVGKRAVDSALLVNNVACSTATTKDMKKLIVNGASGSVNEVVILDFLSGFFAAATATSGVGGIDISLGSGTDDLRIRGTSAKDTMYMGSDNGMSFNADNYKDITVAGVENIAVALAGGDDVFSATNASPIRGVTGNAALAIKLSGGAGNDDLTGGDAADTIYGGLGDDSITGGLLVDTVYGEAGADTFKSLNVTDGNDVIDCGTELDTVSYAARTQVITAVLGTGGGMASESDTYTACENLTGGSGNDVLTGKASEANVIKGGAGDDTITGLTGNDSLYGEAGNDTFDEVDYTKGAGNDVIDGGDGTDTVDYSSRSGSMTITMDGKTADDGESGETDNVAANVENVKGGAGTNTITGNALNNVITGGASADTLNGDDGNDTLVGAAGTDTLNGGDGDDIFSEGAAANGGDIFNGGDGVDTVDYSSRTLTITVTMSLNVANDGDSTVNEGDNVKDDCENVYGGSDIDNLSGNGSDNIILGGAGLDVINGLAGDDFIDGEGGNATVDCGDGDDIAVNTAASPVACEL